MDEVTLDDVVARCRTGDQRAWEELVNATANDMYRLAVSFARSSIEAEDLTQDVYLKIWQNLDRFESGSSFRAWAYRVARNLFVDAYRRSRRERRATWVDPEYLTSLAGGEDPHTVSVRRQRLELARKALADLPEELAQLVLLRDFADWSYEELAREYEIPLGTVKSRLNRARRELAAAMTVVLTPRAAIGVPA